MKTIIFEEAKKVRVEADDQAKVVFLTWYALNGPHYRKAVEALLAYVKKSGITTLISDSSAARDVQSQEDIAFVKQIFPTSGLRLYITIEPGSAIAKMGVNRLGKIAADSGVTRLSAPSLAEALVLAKSRAAA